MSVHLREVCSQRVKFLVRESVQVAFKFSSFLRLCLNGVCVLCTIWNMFRCKQGDFIGSGTLAVVVVFTALTLMG